MARTTRTLAAELRHRREERGLTQAGVAGLAGVSREYVVRLESGKPGSEIGSMMRVVRALGCELSLTVDPRAADASSPSPFDRPWEVDDE
ncbi:helix-turn-helix domain-containing protein [Clavibacter capsici]|uniref:Helix-turn-helix transcriptional regulator n=1 Tax=Clavibacter capsici TaxID=1874630 RepID=A0AAE6XSP1_9MICO|nr:helix-turn-helix domain-containing protein [Clavibacter capsici]ALD13765.1 XRE family transcriptional regulator [Clavibacter capsici]OUE30984.1 anaerobic benzoate catabolism transcriptional regulator [Clavibacter michiganensis]QIS40092.1 helix-turn-helix transcriptional regulator [Clavibacter capsici]QIS45998.1 helix-turn-helix transcriptional regulator [Clavibacter capsici]